MFGEFASYAHNISYGAIVQSIEIVIEAIHDNFVNAWIRLPTSREALDEAAQFNLKSGFPPLIWGAIGKSQLVSKLVVIAVCLKI